MSKHSTEETVIAMTCPYCGTNDRKLAPCSICEVSYCAGECFSMHVDKRPAATVKAKPWLYRLLVAAGARSGRKES